MSKQSCGHEPEIRFIWWGKEQTIQELCGCCAAMVWDKLPQPLKETIVIEDILK